MARAWYSPDCAQGKHTACTGGAWDEDADQATACACPHHDLQERLTERQESLARLLAMGVPYSLALEGLASTSLDRAQTHEVTTRHLSPEDAKVVAEELGALGYRVTEPAWLQDDPDGYRIVDRD